MPGLAGQLDTRNEVENRTGVEVDSYDSFKNGGFPNAWSSWTAGHTE